MSIKQFLILTALNRSNTKMVLRSDDCYHIWNIYGAVEEIKLSRSYGTKLISAGFINQKDGKITLRGQTWIRDQYESLKS